MNTVLGEKSELHLPHRLAVALVCATFPLIWVGGLVTTYDAGMAVPDWPQTYGYNLLMYPWQKWVLGPWDLFIEHGHRLLGALAGMLSLLLAAAIWWRDQRRWMHWLALATVLAVIGQGALGGLRVLRDDVQLAMLHGASGPLFFALGVSLAVFTSRCWNDASRPAPHQEAVGLHVLAWLTCLLAVVQLVLGAQLRHLPASASLSTFRLALMFHLLVAGILLVQVVVLALRIARSHGHAGALTRPAWALVGLVVAQLLLGATTWVVKYSWPWWLADYAWAAHFTIQQQSMSQALTVTAHVATGSLVLATSVMLALRSVRLVPRVTDQAAARGVRLGVLA